MSQELVQKQKCVLMRSGIEKWLDWEKAEELERILQAITSHKFIKVFDETINTADIEGIYKPVTLEELKRRKNGEWKCKSGKWHMKSTKCDCDQESWFKRESQKTDAMLSVVFKKPKDFQSKDFQ